LSVTITKLAAKHPLAQGTLKANGSEQTVVEFVGVGKVCGSIDLQEMKGGDEVVIRQYVKLKEDGSYKKYWEETYKDVQALPAIYFTPKTTNIGIKITLQQTKGILRNFDYNFTVEK